MSGGQRLLWSSAADGCVGGVQTAWMASMLWAAVVPDVTEHGSEVAVCRQHATFESCGVVLARPVASAGWEYCFGVFGVMWDACI